MTASMVGDDEYWYCTACPLNSKVIGAFVVGKDEPISRVAVANNSLVGIAKVFAVCREIDV